MHKINIRSKIRDYTVNFVNDFTIPLRQLIDEKAFLIIDDNINKLYEEKLHNIIPKNRLVTIVAKEENKTLDYCQQLIQTLIKKDIRKNSRLIAMGGGIIQDITAFISSIIFRGIEWSFFPTTLLAQADSCIGSKSSINVSEYKNLVGTFYPPSSIYIDLHFIPTLSREAIRSGIGEILHFYLLAGGRLAERLAVEYGKLLNSPQLLKGYILASLKIKKKIIEIDEFDKKERNLFNYGHTFGHAIEAVTGYAINHGQAVTMGMDIANYISLRLGYLDKDTFFHMHRILSMNMPKFSLDKGRLHDYFQALSKDKKNIGNKLGCILTRGLGSMQKVYIPMGQALKNMITDYFQVAKRI